MKRLLGVAAAILLTTIQGGCGSFALFECENTLARQAISPDGKLKAVVFFRDCAATTSKSAQVSIIDASAPLPNEAGNVFITDKSDVSVKWLSATQLQVTELNGISTYQKSVQHEGVTISYK